MFFIAYLATLYFVFLSIPVNTAQVCRDWDTYKDNCYKFVARSLTVKGQTWKDAEISCQSYGGHLASITNQDEQNFITNKVKQFQNERFWIGYNDRANESYFNWTDGWSATNYTNWRTGEPNDWKGEDCVELVFNNGLWNDENCANTFSYICKRKKGVPWPTQPTVLPPVTQKPIHCGAGWESYGTSCYKFNSASKTWVEASKDCRKSGGYLVKVHNDDEQHYLSYRLRMLKQPMWIGLNDRAVEGTYVWDGENTKVNYTNWFPGEPNDFSGKEDCTQIYNGFFAGLWNDQFCGKTRPYICEIPQGQSLCPANWVPFGDYCLEFNTHPAQALTWSQARDACRATQGADLMSILNQNDQDILFQQLKDLRSGNIWIGLNDIVKEGLFVWNDRSSVKFTNWAQNEPGTGSQAAVKDCVLLVPNVDNGTWATQNCSYLRTYVCKRNRGHDQCNSPLGMQTFQITDSQITASSMKDGPSAPNQARLNLQASITTSGAWCAKKNAQGEYLQVDLGLVRKITHIAVQGRPKSTDYITSFYLRYGNNGLNFVNYGENATQSYRILSGSKSSDVVANVMLPDIINCRFLRIYPLKWSNNICLRTEIYGCDGQASSTKCSAGWTEGPDNTCYQFNNNRYKIWADARATCTSQGGDLLSIVTNNERIYIDSRMKSLANTVNSFWIGLNDRESNRFFQWSDLSPFVVTRWDSGYPKDSKNAKACVELVPSRLAWRDIDCGQYKPFICKKKLDSPHTKKMSLTANWISATDAYWPLDGLLDGKALGTTPAQVNGNVSKATVLHNKKFALQLVSNNGYLQAGKYPNQCIGDADACATGLSVGFIVNLDAPTSAWTSRTFLIDSIGDRNLRTSRGFAFYIEQNQIKVTVCTTKTRWAVSNPLSRGVWHHVAFTWLSGLGLQLYIDGKQKTSDKSGTVMTPTHTSNNVMLTIGSKAGSGLAQGVYYMRSLGVWQRVLDPTEVMDIYNAEFGICSTGWKEYGQYCYQFNRAKRTWPSARTNCQNQGGELVSITSPVEQAHISLEVGIHGLNAFAWIGFHDRSTESVWEWSDGSPTRFTNWYNYQPDNWYWHGEDCGHVYHYTSHLGRWNDIVCTTNMGSICKRKKVPSKAVTPSLPTRQQIICEWSSSNLNCPSSTVISIQKANYGRTSKTTCGTISITNCILNVTQKMKSMCDGQAFCSVNPTNQLFGKDPCKYIRKYLDVTYSCNKGPVTTVGCPVGWQRSPDGNVCYGLMLDKKNWNDASASCKKNGAELVSIHSGMESTMVTSLLVTSWDAGDIWIGLTDQGKRGVYRWSDGSKVDFTHWLNGQPNDRLSSGSCVRATMTVSSRDWMYWMDDDCTSNNLAYVCKKFRHGITPPSKPPTTVPVGACPAGWLPYLFGCYRVFMTKKTWTSARDACRAFTNTDLVSIQNAAENTFVQTLTNSTFDAWIGLNDRGILSGHVWTDGSAVQFTKWGPVQPDSHSGQQPCVVMSPKGYWNDVGCFSTRNYICKMKRPSGGSTKPPTPAPTLATAAPGTCDSGWRYYNKMCYWFSKDTVQARLSWFNARTACRKLGGDLVSLLDAAENAYVYSTLRTIFYSWTAWIGLNDLGTESSYQWSDGRPFSYTNFNWREPNDWSGQEDCLEIIRWNGKWNDNQCGRTRPYICKKYNNSYTPPTTVAPTPGPALGKCDPGWINYDKSCYKIVDNEFQSWKNARARCNQGTNSSKNGDLITINNQYEQAFIIGFFLNHKSWSGFWIGLNDIHTENLFTWINNDQVTYTNWNSGQPLRRWNYDCVDMVGANWAPGRWRVRPCAIKQRYICEVPAQPLGPTTATPTQSPDCPAPFAKYGDSCYSMFYTKLTWNEAKEVCSKYGADLISIHSSYEQAYLISKMFKFPGNVWTGMTREANSATLTWSDQSIQDYTHWASGQPGRAGSSRTCVQVNNTVNGRWTGVDCNNKNGFMCKINKGEPHVTPVEHGTCQPGFKKFDKFCYLFRLWDRQPWSIAKFRCNKLAGGDLVSILNQQEKDFLIYQLKDRKWHSWVWTGLNDRLFERGYQWSDGSPVSFTSWQWKQPDDHFGRQNCVQMFTRSGVWSDIYCSWRRGYICKAKLECSSPLGMASGNISTAQVSASSQMDAAHAPSMGRINGTSGWCAGNTTRGQYFQVDFVDEMEIAKIEIKGVMLFLTQAFVRSFTVSYAVYKNQWKPYQVKGFTRTFSSNWDSKRAVTLKADPPIVARFLRIQPQTWKYKICAKFEFYGCVLECQKPLGIESRLIRDELINASSQSDPQHGATQARPSVGSGWCPLKSDKRPWLQVTWPGFAKRITKIATWGAGTGTNAYVTKYKLAFSEDGSTFVEYQEKGKSRIFRGNSNPTTQLVHVLADPIKTQYFRIIPLSGAQGGVCLRFEIYGCASGCIDPIGMETGTIEDSWISTSSNLDDTHGPGMARLNAPRGWCAATTDKKPFLRVSLGRVYRIRKVSTQGSADGKGYVMSFVLRSFFKNNWMFYRERGKLYMFTANHDSSTVISKTFRSPRRAIQVEFQLKTWSSGGSPCMRVEIFGCIPNNAPTEVPSIQPTGTMIPTTQPQDLAYRVTMKITNVPWTDDYSKRGTASFNNLANQLIAQVTALYNRGEDDMASLAFEKVQIIKFRRGSVVADFNITFFADIAKGANVMQRIKDSANNGSFGNLTVDPNSLSITKIESSGGNTSAQKKGGSGGLSAGAKAAIAIVVILVVACGLLLAAWWIRKNRSGDIAMKHQTFDNPIHFSSKAYDIDEPLPQPFSSD